MEADLPLIRQIHRIAVEGKLPSSIVEFGVDAAADSLPPAPSPEVILPAAAPARL